MKANKVILMSVVATLTLATAVGCNSDKKKKKGSPAPAVEETENKGEAQGEPKKQEVESEAQKRVRLNTSLASMSKVRVQGVSCDEQAKREILSFPLSGPSGQTAFDRLKVASSVESTKESAKLIRKQMMKQGDSQCSLIVISEIAKFFKSEVADVELGRKDSSREEEVFGKIEVVVNEFLPVAERSAEAIEAQQVQEAYVALLDRRDSALAALEVKMGILGTIKDQLFRAGGCVEIDQHVADCDDLDAHNYAEIIRDFEREVAVYTRQIPQELYSASAGQQVLQIQPAVGMMESFVDKADGIIASAQ